MTAVRFSMVEYCEYLNFVSDFFTPNRDFNCPQEQKHSEHCLEEIDLNNLPKDTLIFLNGDCWFYKIKITDGEKGKMVDIWLNSQGDGLRGLVKNIGSFERKGEGWIFEKGIIKRKTTLILMPYFNYDNKDGKMYVKNPDNWAMYHGLNINEVRSPEK